MSHRSMNPPVNKQWLSVSIKAQSDMGHERSMLTHTFLHMSCAYVMYLH